MTSAPRDDLGPEDRASDLEERLDPVLMKVIDNFVIAGFRAGEVITTMQNVLANRQRAYDEAATQIDAPA